MTDVLTDSPPDTPSRLSASRGRVATAQEVASTTGFKSLSTRLVLEARRVHRFVRPFLAWVSPLGWAVFALGVACWIAGTELGWKELLLASATCLLVVVICAASVAGPARLKVEVSLDPSRVAAGDPTAGRISVSNPGNHRSRPVEVDLPVGSGRASFPMPALAPGQEVEELFVIPTERRGVIAVGPATTVKADPLELFVRRLSGGPPTELLVYPKVVPLNPFGTGLLRDLEGLTTKEVSASDLAFHSLREYVAGDDFRFIHWKSSARTGKLQIRQFLDTRRSTLTVVVDDDARSYGDPEDFELALQIAGSLALRAARDDLQSVLAVGTHLSYGSAPHTILDTLARAALDSSRSDLATQAGRAEARAHDTTLAVIVSGRAASPRDIARAAARFAPEVRVVGFRVVPGEKCAVTSVARTTLIQIGKLKDLPGLVEKGSVA